VSGSDRGFSRGARVLSVGIGVTGLVTLAFFVVAAQVLGPDDYGAVATLWSVVFVIASVIYRPVEQLLSRSIAAGTAHSLRVPLTVQAGFAAAFLVVALALREPITDGLFEGAGALYVVLVGAVLAYAASYFARGWLAGHGRFGLYGGLVLLEALTRLCFPLAVLVGVASGQTAVALGILAAPLLSLLLVPPALRRARGETVGTVPSVSLREGGAFAAAVLAVQAAEQTVLNVAVLTVADAAVAGIVFNVLLVARAPLQLFQAVQTSLLPHLTVADPAEFRRAVRVTLLAIAAFAGAVALALLLVGPPVMEAVFAGEYARAPLALVAVGMGCHLAAGTFTPAALARGHARGAAAAWVLCAALFVAWLLVPAVDDRVLRAALGYLGATALLAALLARVVRR
jgi:O-antigen/teichoic acid export membrane protein